MATDHHDPEFFTTVGFKALEPVDGVWRWGAVQRSDKNLISEAGKTHLVCDTYELLKGADLPEDLGALQKLLAAAFMQGMKAEGDRLRRAKYRQFDS